jgi:glycosyltransferase involved in cell wall biosynthesis
MSDRKKILVVSTTLSQGGAERFASVLITHLNRKIFDPQLCVLRKKIDYHLPKDIPLVTLEKNKPWHLWRAAQRLRATIERNRPHIILSTISNTNLITGMALSGSRIRPLWIARIGNFPAHWEDKLLRFIYYWIYKRVNFFVTISRKLQDEFVKVYPFAANRVQTIYNAADFTQIDQLANEPPLIDVTPGVPLIMTVGRLDKQKRPDIYLKAFTKVRKEMPAEFWICGEGRLRSWLTREIKAKGLKDSVKLLGFCKNPFALLKQASLFVLSSDYEGLCYSLVEAQGIGIPAVSTRCPCGPDEVIEDGNTGLLTPVGDPRAIAECIINLLSDPLRRETMGIAARQRARKLFDTQRVIHQWEKLFEKLIDNNPH